ncbi:hypothetical protein [Sutcliffiella halmapala]|uniref:hypothetical protein n=1 Tax=Sutcliffiella halmapala TaxID=79882 RepID=UPI001F3F2D1B|nr:hypothetical protein [Sutcliffiella halmapala]
MGIIKKSSMKEWLLTMIVAVFIIGTATYYILFFTPKNSLELYQAISFADNFEKAQKVMLEGYEANFDKEDYDYINRLDISPNRISQFTIFEYDEKTYMVMTTPGTERLQVLAVEELPKEIRDYFLGIDP